MNDINPLVWVIFLVIVIVLITYMIKHQSKPVPVKVQSLLEVRESQLQKAELELAQEELRAEESEATVVLLKDRIERLKRELGYDKLVPSEPAVHDIGRANPVMKF